MERLLIEYLGNALWQLPLLASAAWLLLRITGATPLAQYRVWVAVFALSVLLPAHGIVSENPAPTQARRYAFPAASGPVAASVPLAPRQTNPRRQFEELQPPAMPRTVSIKLTPALLHCITGLYLATLLYGLARITRAWRLTTTLVQHATETTLPPHLAAMLADHCRNFGIQPPLLRTSRDLASPAVVGALRPILLLPASLTDSAEKEIEAALCHELAHILRRDYLGHLVCQFAALPVAWHPAMCFVDRRIRRTREMVCDAIAAREMHSELGYAKCLLALSQGMLGTSRVARHSRALGLFNQNILEERVMRLTTKKARITLRAKAARLASGATVMLAALALATLFHVTPTLAQQQPPSIAPIPPAPAAVPSAAKPGPNTRTAHKRKHRPVEIVNGECRELTPEEEARVEREMSAARQQIAEATRKLQSAEFQKQIADAQRQAVAAAAKLNSPEFQKLVADTQREAMAAAAKLNSSEFQKQMADAQRQITEVTEAMAKLKSAEFQNQMEQLQQQLRSNGWERPDATHGAPDTQR